MTKLSIIIPVFDERNTIQKILDKIEHVFLPDIEKEIIIIDDGSVDGTREILKKLNDKYHIFYHEKNIGKGAAVKTGFENATGDIILIQDADLEYNPDEYPKLLNPILNHTADVVYGSRLMTNEPHRVIYYWHYLGNKFLTTLSNVFSNLNLSDMETCYKVFKYNVVQTIKPHLTAKDFTIEPQITALIAKYKFRIYEVGISYHGRSYQEGKKINWRDGFKAVWAILKYNLFTK